MYRTASLLERLDAAASGQGARTVQEDRSAAVRSIVRNLQRMLNSRQGNAPAQMDLGIPSPHELMQGYPATLEQTIKVIRTCIMRYEPRLSAVVVSHVPSDQAAAAISFRITAQLAGDGAREQLSLQTAISANGRIRLANT
jgi:type VI secretion system protein